MVILNYVLIVIFALVVFLDYAYSRAVKWEKPLAVQEELKMWADGINAVGTVFLAIQLGAWALCGIQGVAVPTLPGALVLNVLLGVSLVQRAGHAIWKWCGYILLTLTLIVIVGSIGGCGTSTKYQDPVQPVGAVTTTVPVPTCGDDLAKALFIVSERPKVLPINLLTAADKDNYELVSTAYVESLQIMTAYAVSLERDRASAQQQCKAIRQQVDTLNTKTPVIPVTQ